MKLPTLQGPIEVVRLAVAEIGPATARDIERNPKVVAACRSSKTKARRHLDRLVLLGHVVSDSAQQMPKFSIRPQQP